MSDEEKKEIGEDAPTPPSEEAPEVPNPTGETPKDEGNTNQSEVELQKIKKENEELKRKSQIASSR